MNWREIERHLVDVVEAQRGFRIEVGDDGGYHARIVCHEHFGRKPLRDCPACTAPDLSLTEIAKRLAERGLKVEFNPVIREQDRCLGTD